MNFFSDEEIDSLKITRMILHVVGTKNFEALPERALEEEAFFIGKIVDMAAAPVFMFKAVSTTRNEIQAIATGDTSFATEAGFKAFLDNGHSASRWCVLGLLKPFNTRARAYTDWGIEEPYVESQATKSPRLLVKESADVRTVPEDVRQWLLADGHELDEAEAQSVRRGFE